MAAERTLRTIAIATDFSENAMAAFAWALEIARQQRSELVVVHALLPATPPAPEFVQMPERYYRDVRDEARARLEALMAEVRPAGLSISVELVVGATAPGILAASGKRHAELLVVGTRGLTGWKRIVLGSTAAQVVRDAQLPVLTVHPADGRRASAPRTILVPTDFSSDAWLATETALRLLSPAEAGRLVLLHAYRLPGGTSARHDAHDASDAIAESERAARGAVDALAKSFVRPNLVVETVVAEGLPAQLVVEHATRLDADLVAMGTHGRSALERLWIGSTAERVIASAPCPVLTVRAPRT